jgi:L-Ala-D/L-Glu epimerase
LGTALERFPLASPFYITGYCWYHIEVLVVTLEQDGHQGTGEASGVYYKSETPASMFRQVESIRDAIERGIDRGALQQLLPAGGARNALDCALWDLEAKVTGRSAWQLAGLSAPRPLVTTFTCGAADPDGMAKTACEYRGARAIKLKLTGERPDADRVRAVRAARPDVWLGVDANQGFTRPTLEALMPVLSDCDVALIEQPFPVGQETWLDGLASSIPIAADESAQEISDVARLADRFQVINIKLDKCGGLTQGLAMAREARRLGLEPMVGNMIGTSLAMAPAWLLGQLCRVVDLDGPALLAHDRPIAVDYADGLVSAPEALWGGPG